ncbi:hypothetical protein VPH35_050684 [Triticum aestivum]|uniref:uncharacterized protein n=1 Tax=Triticum aestivum TaxID=4565 RepID=UPI000844BC94|nr:uncharacterized protein LOC123065076 [Triticum aestivum]
MEDARSTWDSPSHPTPTMAAAGSTASMKLFVDAGARRVVFAEAGKDVVDFLFSLLALPLGRADRLLAPLGGAGGSVGNLYASVERLDPAHVQPGVADKKALLHPTVLSPPARVEHSFHPRRELYTCPSAGIYCLECARNVTDWKGTRCPSCGDEMTLEARYVPPAPRFSSTAGKGEAGVAAPEGFVRGGAATRYIVTDDLQVRPSSAGELVALCPALGPADVGALRELDVQLGFKEGKEILKAVMMQSRTVLTDVFRVAVRDLGSFPEFIFADWLPALQAAEETLG